MFIFAFHSVFYLMISFNLLPDHFSLFSLSITRKCVSTDI